MRRWQRYFERLINRSLKELDNLWLRLWLDPATQVQVVSPPHKEVHLLGAEQDYGSRLRGRGSNAKRMRLDQRRLARHDRAILRRQVSLTPF